jgi:hypothetical protein
MEIVSENSTGQLLVFAMTGKLKETHEYDTCKSTFIQKQALM